MTTKALRNSTENTRDMTMKTEKNRFHNFPRVTKHASTNLVLRDDALTRHDYGNTHGLIFNAIYLPAVQASYNAEQRYILL